mmetsp:Transcript_19865/g.50816  ORF Transcript_19865/g.50816 Transcript_19865/m.50816 type:complete len:448 (-) Transcript_19865:200-1543(-)
MVRDELLGGVVRQGAALQASDDAVGGIVDLLQSHSRLVAARGKDGRLVHQVLKVGTAEAGGALGHLLQSDLLGELLVLDVHPENLLAALDVRQANLHATVKAARAQKCAVKDVCAVRCRNNNDTAVALEAVHLSQDLVQGLLTLVVATAHARAALATNGIDLVDEDDARGLLLRLLEDVAYAGRAHTNEELDELGGRRLDEGHTRLTCQRLRHQRLTSSGGAREQNTLGDLGTDLHEALRGLEEVHNLGELLLGLVDASHILELHASLWLNLDLGLALHARHAGHAATSAAAAAKEEQTRNDQQRKGDIAKDRQSLVRLLRRVHLNGDSLGRQLVHEASGRARQVADELLLAVANLDQGNRRLAQVIEVNTLHAALIDELQEARERDAARDAGRLLHHLLLRHRRRWRGHVARDVICRGSKGHRSRCQGCQHLRGDAAQDVSCEGRS